jgi:hypothetical protein
MRILDWDFTVKEVSMTAKTRELGDLISIGPAMLRDFEMLGIRSVEELARRDPQRMYEKIERLTGQRQDPCVLDTFCAAVAQAKNPRLAAEQCQWWWWSRKRKQGYKDVGKKQRKQNLHRDRREHRVHGKEKDRAKLTR